MRTIRRLIHDSKCSRPHQLVDALSSNVFPSAEKVRGCSPTLQRGRIRPWSGATGIASTPSQGTRRPIDLATSHLHRRCSGRPRRIHKDEIGEVGLHRWVFPSPGVQPNSWTRGHRHRRTSHDDRVVNCATSLQAGQTDWERETRVAKQHINRPDEVIPAAQERQHEQGRQDSLGVGEHDLEDGREWSSSVNPAVTRTNQEPTSPYPGTSSFVRAPEGPPTAPNPHRECPEPFVCWIG